MLCLGALPGCSAWVPGCSAWVLCLGARVLCMGALPGCPGALHGCSGTTARRAILRRQLPAGPAARVGHTCWFHTRGGPTPEVEPHQGYLNVDAARMHTSAGACLRSMAAATRQLLSLRHGWP
eukprot:364600-Chlamydomonas_euryale.AAC.5